MKLKYIICIIIFYSSTIAFATDYYCNPATGNMSNDGSLATPWSTLEAVFVANKTFAAGDIIYLMDGFHGNPSVKGVNSDYVTIKIHPGDSPTLSLIKFGNSVATTKWIVEGLTIGAEYNSTYHNSTLVYTGSAASFIKIKNTTIFSKEDISSWTLADWNSNVSNGVIFAGSNCSIENSVIKNIRTGIQFDGINCAAYNNSILNFAGDGLRALADNGVFEYNLIQDNYVIDANHDDGFQSWTNDGGVGNGTIKDVVLVGNTFINYTDPTRDFLGPLQGIFGTDGMFDNFHIENNIVVVDQWHGITLTGSTNATIINNTIIDTYFNETYPGHLAGTNYEGPLGPTWIRIKDHKDGVQQSTDNVLRNNITNQIVLDESYNGVQDHNLIINGNSDSDYINIFSDWSNFDFHLQASSSPIDFGISTLASVIDADKNSRPIGVSIDAGVFEYGSVTTTGETSASVWQTFNKSEYSQLFTAEFDLKPNRNNIDGVVGIVKGEANSYSDLSCIVRLNTSGNLDAYDSNTYSSGSSISYQVGDTFHIKIQIDFNSQTYDVLVSKNGGAEELLAGNYGFRNPSSSLDSWSIKKEQGSHTISNMVFYNGVLNVDANTIENELLLYPTINNIGRFNLLNSYPESSAKIQLISILGKSYEELNIFLKSGITSFKFKKFENLPIGIYFIKIQIDNKIQTIKIVKSN